MFLNKLIRFKKLSPDAVIPTHALEHDTGYDVTVTRIDRTVGTTVFYGTGIAMQPPPGFYMDLAPRSSLAKTGYIFANSIGVIDEGYRGEIFVSLIKIDPNAPDLELPCRVAQLVLRKRHIADVMEIDEDFEPTERGIYGFGSTGA